MSPPGMFTQVSLQVVLVVGVGTDLRYGLGFQG